MLDASALRAVAYSLLLESGYEVNHHPPAVYCLAVGHRTARDATAVDPPPEAFPPPSSDRDAPEILPVSRCPEGGLVLYTADVEWKDDTHAVVEAGMLRIQCAAYRTWKEKPDRRRITIERQPDRGLVVIDWVAVPDR